MTYIYILYFIITAAIIVFILTYLPFNREEETIENPLEDITNVSLSREELERHALRISENFSAVRERNSRKMIVKGLDQNYSNILKGYEYLDMEVRSGRDILPAGEWLLDNIYLIEKDYKDIKFNMPKSYYANLPVLKRGIMKGYPRVYYIAVEMVTHTDGKINEDNIECFIKAYEKNAVLTSGELWAMPIMLRTALIQSISKSVDNLVFAQKERKKAENLADKLINSYHDNKIEGEINNLKNENIKFTAPFVERILKLLRDNGVDSGKLYSFIDEVLDLMDTSSERIINSEHQRQANLRLSVSNAIEGLREVEALNWKDAFEKLSYIEEMLRKDPSAVYEKMDFMSRDYYRHVVEKLAREFNKPESYVAKKVLECAEAPENNKEEEYEKHVGYYLIDDGIDCLKKKAEFRGGFNYNAARFIRKNLTSFYIGSIFLGTALIVGIILNLSFNYDINPISWRYILAVAAILIPSSEIAVAIINWGITHIVHPRFIPKLEFRESIPEEYSTIVAISALLGNSAKVKELLTKLEVNYLANREKNLYFAILGDFKDSTSYEDKGDRLIVEQILKGVKELNSKYSKGAEDIFYILNRCRRFNEKEGKWIGWERKRGKLMELNALLRGGDTTSYNIISSDINRLPRVKYIIALDEDTKLTIGTAKKLIGAMAHTLNRAHMEGGKKVVRGFGLMQPRIGINISCAYRSLFSKIFSGETGVDTYTTAVSDVYEDLFGEGIYTGKGIYDIDVFNSVLKDEIPENSVLSHDLLEGAYVRAALVSDLELIDGCPSSYISASLRLHRWVRGDWQLIPWLTKRSVLSGLCKWKIFDNLRRSLTAPSLIILIVLSLTLLPGIIDIWLTLAFLTLLCPILFSISEVVVVYSRGMSLLNRIKNWQNILEQLFLVFCFLPYQSYLMADAIIRTLYRLYISKKNLLQWQTSADVEARIKRNFKGATKAMWQGSVIALLIELLALLKSFHAGIIMLPAFILWFISPYISSLISRESNVKDSELSLEEKKVLRKLSRRTWAYFEDFVGEEDNFLAPDNFQEEPYRGIAHRTSPTNIGMGLISNIAAFDLGYVDVKELSDRLDKILLSMESLEKYRGHFYNWYDTTDKLPLQPKYISTVDSGNLLGYLWITSHALMNYLKEPLLQSKSGRGLCDTMELCYEEIEGISGIKELYSARVRELIEGNYDLNRWRKLLTATKGEIAEIERLKGDKETYWNDKLKNSIGSKLKDIDRFFPWSKLVSDPPSEFMDVCKRMIKLPFSVGIEELEVKLQEILKELNAASSEKEEISEWKKEITSKINTSISEIARLRLKIENLRLRLELISENMDFTFLYNKRRKLFAIGFDVERESIGNSYYDLLASESRTASLLAIAKGDVEAEHWQSLGRAITMLNSSKALASWSGTMFEYLMPLLIMKSYPGTLLDETYKAIVKAQIRYGRSRRVPWGISEAAYYSFDAVLNYQYKAFGVPGVGLKRGLVNELVVSPYSTVMALMVNLRASMDNIKAFIEKGIMGKYGFYESIDYTEGRLPKGEKSSVIKCFMVHHQGMSLMALNNVLNKNELVERFHEIPMVMAVELLLQEKMPKRIVYSRKMRFEPSGRHYERIRMITRTYSTAKTGMPETQLLSNGNYSLMLSNSGSGYSRKGNMTIYRWREDVTLDSSGMFFYIKNLNCNEYWSAAYEPCKTEGEEYKVIFSQDRVEFKRKDGNLSTSTEIVVSSEDNAEIRKLTITNHSGSSRTIEVTSYCEVTLAPYNADLVHPAFSNLFIKTEFMSDPPCIIGTRRARSKGEKMPWIVQVTSLEGESAGPFQYETSRVNFIGRERDLSRPKAMDSDTPLENTVGAVLDPIISIRRRIKIAQGGSCKIAYTTAITDSREEALKMAVKYSSMENVNRCFEFSFSESQLEMKYLGIRASQANLYQLMATKILFLSNLMGSREEYIKNINKGQSSLWKYGISGDLPIVLLIVREEKDIDLTRQLLKAHEYWSIKGLRTDLIIINLQDSIYVQPFQESLRDIIASSHARDKQNKSGGIFLFSKETIPSDDVDFLRGISRLVIDSEKGLLISQIKKTMNIVQDTEKLEIKEVSYNEEQSFLKPPKLEYFNGFGGFDMEKEEYTIILKDGCNTPAPWINVMTNGQFGFHVSESGVAYTWYKNSRENKLTTWSNDWIIDGISEGLYFRDEVSGKLWSISPKPIRDEGTYIINHGFGYSTFKHEAYGIYGETTMFVPIDDNVKLCMIKVKNNSKEIRKISTAYYAQLVLGVTREQSYQYISTYIDNVKKYIYAKNPYSEHFGKQAVYLKIFGGEEESFTGNRTEFIGRGESLCKPEALRRKTLSDTAGGGYDPCLAAMTKVTLNPGEEKSLLVIFGAADEKSIMEKVLTTYENMENAQLKFETVKNYWSELLHKIEVTTPDKTMDIMLNGWLMYQTIACRMWSRTAFYQSGGAYGFRDQLQDSMAVSLLDSSITRKQILLSASRQFSEGDVQHWWHPFVDSGIRTRFSDDLLWLPYVTIDYIKNTGDYEILNEKINYLEDEPLKEGEDERYNVSKISKEKGTLYDHCRRSIDRSLKFGIHNIPLMGSGDWNDGMSTVGNKGKGESVWLGWFLYSILDKFKELCQFEKDETYLKKCEELSKFIKDNLEKNAWDGSWYRRAYFDDGTPLGSAENEECQIDSLSQSWAVISEAAKTSRAEEALDALWKYLVREDKGLVLLLTPAFDSSSLEPGYIKGYVPGVRENGGQYTHAATWAVLALSMADECNKAWKVFNMINPINHSKSFMDCEKYKVEPYVMTADVYAVEPHTGRGGWSWYTGAAGWMYRVGLEGILGLKFKGKEGFTIEPCVPLEWDKYTIIYKRGNCKYEIQVTRGDNKGAFLDGNTLENKVVPFLQEGTHEVSFII